MKTHFLIKGLFLTVMLMIVAPLSAGTYSGGSGTEGDPYQIATTADLIELSNTSGDWGKYFIQSVDISFNADETQVDWDGDDDGGNWDINDQKGFLPIGTEGGTHFFGYYDGNNHTISNLFINRPTMDDVALFGYTDRDYGKDRSYIKNLALINVDITGGYRTGGLGARVMSNISYCYVTGSIIGSAGNSVAGGLVAQSHYTITDCYSTVSVSAQHQAAGFISFNNGTTQNCYSTGSVSDASDLDGFCNNADGHGGGELTNCFWDTQTSGQSSSAGGTGKTTAEMKDVATFTDTDTDGLSTAWDFETNPNDDAANNDYWDIDNSGSTHNGYPFLTWQNGSDIPLPIELISFTANMMNGAVGLRWHTGTETNNACFLIYRNDEVIANIEGAGTSSEPHSYSYTDNEVIPGVSYTYILADISYANEEVKHREKAVTVIIPENDMPQEFSLENNYPNPFNPSTSISYQLTENCDLELSIYDMDGNIVATLINDNISAGYHTVNWNASGLSSGIYFYRLTAGKLVETKKMVLMK